MTAPDGRVDPVRMRAADETTREGVHATPVRSRRAVARIDRALQMVARAGCLRLESDEPRSRGGLDRAPASLQNRLAGAAR